PRGVYGVREMLTRDLAALGIRDRHFHALRHTFVSLALASGARGEILKRATHAPPKAAFDMYWETDSPALCAEVAKLNLSPMCPDKCQSVSLSAEKPANQAADTASPTGFEGVLDAKRVEIRLPN